MKKFYLFWPLVFAISIKCLISNATPLDDYVYKPDDHYRYDIITQYNMNGYTLFVFNMTSQKWLDGNKLIQKSYFLINPDFLILLYKKLLCEIQFGGII
jgi:hypothetical protein